MESSPGARRPGGDEQAEERAILQTLARNATQPRGTGTIFRVGRFWHIGYYVASGKQIIDSNPSSRPVCKGTDSPQWFRNSRSFFPKSSRLGLDLD